MTRPSNHEMIDGPIPQHPLRRRRRVLAWLAGTLLVLTGAFALAGCSTGGSVEDGAPIFTNDSSLYENRFTLSDGRIVTCIALLNSSRGGLSCDWAEAAR